MRGLINLDRANWMTRDGRYESYEVSRHFTLRFQPKGTDEMELSVAPANLRAALTLQCLAHRAGGARTRSCKRAARSLRSVARAEVDPTKRFAQTGVGLTSTIAERVQGRAECYPSVTRLGCSSRAIAGIAGVYGDTAPDAALTKSLGDCSPISGINPPGAASADSAFAESPIEWPNRPLDRSAQRERRICAHVTAARRNSHFIRTVLANSSRELEGWGCRSSRINSR